MSSLAPPLHPGHRRPKSATSLLSSPRSTTHANYNSAFTTKPASRSRLPAADSSRSSSFMRQPKAASRSRYGYAAFFLILCLVSFIVQTETAVYIQSHLGWNKAYCMLYLTHGSWVFLWPLQLAILRFFKRDRPWNVFWRRHVHLLRTTCEMIIRQQAQPERRLPANIHKTRLPNSQIIRYMVRTTVLVTSALTIAGSSWYIAVNLTSSSDLTAIYNCSAFFAYAFSVPLLKEKLRMSKVVAVGIAIVGVLVVAYGGEADPNSTTEPKNRPLGNLLIGIGSVLYGLYEVLYKQLACPPTINGPVSPGRSVAFANTVGSMIGLFTLLVLWIPLPVLHVLGWETFEIPSRETAWVLCLTIISNFAFSGSFLVLISLTSPVLSSVAALLTIFLVAIVDELLPEPFRQPLTKAALWGGLLIVIAFALLAWDTYKEVIEEEEEKGRPVPTAPGGFVAVPGSDSSDDDSDDQRRSVEMHGPLPRAQV